ncbi:MAG: hypothetical protein ACRERC_06645 [Candidatus Binatia bacterium]
MPPATRALVIAAICATIATPAIAKSPLNPTTTMRDNLSALAQAKAPVTVVLKNGNSYTARIGDVGDHLVVLSEPSQKEFFDVLVVIDDITALEVRAR